MQNKLELLEKHPAFIHIDRLLERAWRISDFTCGTYLIAKEHGNYGLIYINQEGNEDGFMLTGEEAREDILQQLLQNESEAIELHVGPTETLKLTQRFNSIKKNLPIIKAFDALAHFPKQIVQALFQDYSNRFRKHEENIAVSNAIDEIIFSENPNEEFIQDTIRLLFAVVDHYENPPRNISAYIDFGNDILHNKFFRNADWDKVSRSIDVRDRMPHLCQFLTENGLLTEVKNEQTTDNNDNNDNGYTPSLSF